MGETADSAAGDGAADYACLSVLPASKVRVRFVGRFQGEEQLWEMTLYTLACYYAEHSATAPATARRMRARSFIDIQAASNGGYRVDVALAVPIIDAPTVKKTVTMMRNYRRLRVGRHEWGEAVAIMPHCHP